MELIQAASSRQLLAHLISDLLYQFLTTKQYQYTQRHIFHQYFAAIVQVQATLSDRHYTIGFFKLLTSYDLAC